MNRQEKLKFDYEEYFDGLFESTSILMWSTRYAAFTFAFYLNHLYEMNLEKRDDIIIEINGEPHSCPVYHRQDNVSHQTYILVDNTWGDTKKRTVFFDKILLIIGADPGELAERILGDTTLASSSTGLLANERDAMIESFVNSGILESALFDFSDSDNPRTSYFPSTAVKESVLKKQNQFLKVHRTFVADLLLALDSLLPDFESELEW